MMIEKNTIINTEQQAKKLCDPSEKFAQKYEACLGKQ